MEINRARRVFPVVFLALTLSAVVAAEDRKSDSPRKEPPKPVLRVYPSDGQEKITIDVKDADIRDVLRIFEMLTKKNFAIDPEVKGSVTMRLEDVRWQDALDVVLRSNGFASEIDGRIVRVATPAKLAGEKP
jgi:type II secretory pathway component HofQ